MGHHKSVTCSVKGVEGRSVAQHRRDRLKLFRDETVELNLLGPRSPRVGESSGPEGGGGRGPGEEKRRYTCKYCDKSFSNSQALGGHQSAHKLMRKALKREKEAAERCVDQLMYPYPYPHPHPYQPFPPSMFPNLERPVANHLGPNARSFIRKPNHMTPVYNRYSSWPRSSFAGLRIDPSHGSGQLWTETRAAVIPPHFVGLSHQQQPFMASSLAAEPLSGFEARPNPEARSRAEARQGGLASKQEEYQSLPNLSLNL